jgi:hypothetical protein
MCACRLLGFNSVFWQSFQAFGGVFFGGALLYLMSSPQQDTHTPCQITPNIPKVNLVYHSMGFERNLEYLRVISQVSSECL